ncbi:CDK5 regulatory subunit-associated protein 2 isoform X2 [Nerophis ophidion]|uniref:CDK5 regulatory subunit-associated protein 2 isoform X2 n=1 Tax=Nerophis ophidion TaxID=159077 RepID=UPI002ADFBDB5|nr:CDK5 regulatory subunit-associated protein 2 isoform X2 [Nerophis ophidion]
MKDSCRVCHGRLIGNQCRWIFSSSGKRKIQIILSHVLGWEVTRDGRGEFLCGKCVFQLEKVVQCDVNLSQLQEKHNNQVQKLQAEKEHLMQCIVHVYNKNNTGQERSDEERAQRSKSHLSSSGATSFDDEDTCLLASDAQSSRQSEGGARMRRCVSLDRLVSKGVFPGRSGLRKWRMGSAVGLDSSMKSFGLLGSRCISKSMYLDLVQYKGTIPRPEFKDRSTSMLSLNRDFASDNTDIPGKNKLRVAKTLVVSKAASDEDYGGKAQAMFLLRRSSRQPSVISDLTQLLRCITKHRVSVPPGSRIPVSKRLSVGHISVGRKRVRKEAEWKSLHDLTEEFDDKYTPVTMEVHQKKSEVSRLESVNKLLSEELTQVKTTHESLTKALEEAQNQTNTLSGNLEEKENELDTEKKNSLKRDKTIQGLTKVLKEKEKEIAELCHEIEDRDDALAKARETAHKAQMQKYQGAEEHQTLLMEKQTELVQLQGEHHIKVLEVQKLMRSLDRKEQELADLQQIKDQLEVELEDMQHQKKKGDKVLNDLNNQLKKLSSEIGERESSLEHQYQEVLDQTKRKLQAHEVTIQRLTSSLADKEKQLQEYINIVREFEQNNSPAGNDSVLAKLRQRLKEKENALDQALDEKFAAIEEKDNEIHQLQLSLREKERDLERLNNLLSHNEETINSFDSLIKEKDVELQHLTNTLKNLQRAKQDVEDNLNRSLREKDSIISQLQLSLSGKTKDLEEMAESMLSQSQSQAHDFAEQMGQRLKVTEAMLAEAVKARERLISDNETAVEGLLATIKSKDQLLKESAEHYNRMLSERSQEIQELRKQLSDKQQKLMAAQKQNTTATQKGSLETAELQVLLAEKDSLIDRLLQHGQERDHLMTEHDKAPDNVLELRQTIRIMQERLEEREAELSRRNSDDSMENIPLSKKTVVILKKELAQKTEALNKALKRENELKISLAELQSLLSELEVRSEGQAANIESLTATMETKDEIILVLQQRLGQGDHSQDRAISSSMDRSHTGLPQRERTMIGGDSQQEVLPSLVALQQEHEALNKALRAEQQLYSSLVRTVKEQDSAQRFHALQMELTAVQLLRQKHEDSIKTNEDLRDNLEQELDRAKAREGQSAVDPKELESVRHQLEDAQRWNTSLQTRLGAIQDRGGGVGGAKDCDVFASGDTLSFICDQTSYMSICVGEGQDYSSPLELKQKVLELQDCVSRLETLNSELKNRLSSLEKTKHNDAFSKEAIDNPWNQQLERKTDTPQVPYPTYRSFQDSWSQTDLKHGQPFGDESVDSGLGQNRAHAHSANADIIETSRDEVTLKSLLTDCKATSLLQLREEVLRLTTENVQLRGLLKEHRSTECKEKESEDASENSSDGQSRETSQPAIKVQAIVTKMAKEDEKNANDGWTPVPTGEANDQSKTSKHKVSIRSRLPVLVKQRMEACSNSQSERDSDYVQPLHADAFQQLFLNSDSTMSSQPSTCPSSSHGPAYDSGCPATHTLDNTQDSCALFTQLELLHQECQEKETLIRKLSEQLADWQELRAQLQEKERLNRQYMEALQAAESTIADLTACSLDIQGEFGTHTSMGTASGCGDSEATFCGRCIDLQKALREKENLNNHLTQLLNMAEKLILSSDSQEKQSEIRDLCFEIEAVNVASNTQSSSGVSEGTDGSSHELQPHSLSIQDEVLCDQDRLNSAEINSISAQMMSGSFKEKELRDIEVAQGCLDKEMTKVLAKCLSLTESVITYLAAHCANGSLTTVDLQAHLDNLQNALQERQELERLTQTAQPSSAALTEPHPALYCSLQLLFKVFAERSQRICELQASLQVERACGEQNEAHAVVLDAKGLPPSVQAQLEALHKALREKKKTCKNLEEKLASVTMTPSPNTTQRALEKDDKGVQVDCQDLGYETTGKSENNREECSSTDREVAVNPSGSLPLLRAHEQAHFSSTENLYSTSSTPYPSSPTLSSAKASMKSPLAYEDCGLSDDPLHLQTQVRDLKIQLESQNKIILQLQSLLRRNSCDPMASHSDQSMDQDSSQGRSHNRRPSQGQIGEKEDVGEDQAIKSKSSHMNREAGRNNSMKEQLQHNRSRSTSPASLDSLVQSQARELSQLRQQIKDSRRQAALQRRQMGELSRSLQEMLQASEVDCYMGEVVKGQLDKSLSILEGLEGRLDKGEAQLDNEDMAALELSRSVCGPTDSPAQIQQEINNLRQELEGERQRLRHHVIFMLQHNVNAAERASERFDLLAKELQEKNRLIQSLQNQVRGYSPSSHHNSHFDLHPLDKMASSCHGSSPTQDQRRARDACGTLAVGGSREESLGGDQETGSQLLGLQRENERLQEELRTSGQLNATLHSELEVHYSIMTHRPDRDQDHEDVRSQTKQPTLINSALLSEHLQEIRALRERLEESISTNDRLRVQLEKKLAEVEKDRATNIFIHGSEEQSQLVSEVRFLWGQNQVLKEQLSLECKDMQKESERLQENLARRTAKLEQSRKEYEVLRQEKELLQDSLHASQEQICSLQDQVKLHRQQFSDSQHLMQSLRVELQVHEKLRSDATQQSSSVTQEAPPSGSLDLAELLSEIRHLRLQLERSIDNNTLLRHKLEEQLQRGAARSETININYLMSSADEGSRSPGHKEHSSVLPDANRQAPSKPDGGDSSSGESVTGAPFRLVPGHGMWANHKGRHILALVEDYNALRKHISDGRKLSRRMDAQLQEWRTSKTADRQSASDLSGCVGAMQHVLDEAARLLKLAWKVSLPTGAAEDNQQDKLLQNEIARLKSRLSQREKMLRSVVKRLQITNQLKEGMERVLIERLSLTHGVMKNARVNLEKSHCYLFGPRGAAGGGAKWPVGGAGVYPRSSLDSSEEQ